MTLMKGKSEFLAIWAARDVLPLLGGPEDAHRYNKYMYIILYHPNSAIIGTIYTAFSNFGPPIKDTFKPLATNQGKQKEISLLQIKI